MSIFRNLLFNSDSKITPSDNFITIELASSNVTDLSMTGYVQNSKDGTQTGFSVQFTESTRSVNIPVNDVGDLIHFDRVDSYNTFSIVSGATVKSQDDLTFNAKIDSFPCTIEVTYNTSQTDHTKQEGVVENAFYLQPYPPQAPSVRRIVTNYNVIYFPFTYVTPPSITLITSDGVDVTATISPKITVNSFSIYAGVVIGQLSSQDKPYIPTLYWYSDGTRKTTR